MTKMCFLVKDLEMRLSRSLDLLNLRLGRAVILNAGKGREREGFDVEGGR